jgi:hypothetical protein
MNGIWVDTAQGLPVTNVFAYNQCSEVTNAAMGDADYRYLYDDIGNRRQSVVAVGNGQPDDTVYTANSLNQYTNLQSTAYSLQPSCDLDGNMLTNGVWTYAWDAENRMVSASNTVSGVAVTNAYDHMKRRVLMVSGPSPGTTSGTAGTLRRRSWSIRLRVPRTSTSTRVAWTFRVQPRALAG